MKHLIKAYTSFTRRQRAGLAALCILLVALITFKATMHHWAQPTFNVKEQAALVSAYETQQQQPGNFQKTTPNRQQTTTTGESETHEETGQSAKSAQSVVQTFDPNTVDSPTLRRMGLRPITIGNLMKWRAKGKRFYRKQDLKPLYTLTPAEYQMLEPFISIKPQRVNLNTADSATLVSLRGIGPKIAHKILARRSITGPFTSHSQLLELYKFPDSVFERLKKEIIISP